MIASLHRGFPMIVFLCFALLSCHNYKDTPVGTTDPSAINHAAWDQLLQKYVDSTGVVDYQGFIAEKQKFESYLHMLSAFPPAADWPEADKLAYWINAYNAFTVKVIVDHYRPESIRDLNTIPGVATIWHKEFFSIGGQPASLDQIEHSILRREFDEPRIHFAINCASRSCPVLRNEAYRAENLEFQLTDQARRFLREPLRNQISEENVLLSPIFLWFQSDFMRHSTLIEFLNQYAPVPIRPHADISYLDYDWSLNDQP